MQKTFSIQEYMTKGVEHVMADAMKATLNNPKERSYLLKFAMSSRTASRARARAAEAGEHVPP